MLPVFPLAVVVAPDLVLDAVAEWVGDAVALVFALLEIN